MKNILTNISRMGLFQSLTAIAVLCIALPVRAALPYPTVSTVSELTADINDANKAGGTYTIYLQPNTGFTNGQGYIGGGTNTVNLTIIGNGDSFYAGLEINFFDVAAGSSLTLEQMSLLYGTALYSAGGAIYNSGTLTISNCTLSGNSSLGTAYDSGFLGEGGAIFNEGTVIIDNSILSNNSATGDDSPAGGAIYNEFPGTVTISNSTFINNFAQDTSDPPTVSSGGAIYNAGTMTISHSSFTGNFAAYGVGGAIYNAGTLTVENSSRISQNNDVANDATLYLDSSSEIGIVDWNPAIIVQGSGPSPSPQISLASSNTIVVSWPYPSTGWSLEQNSDLTTTNWVTSTNTVANDGTNNFIIAAPSFDQMFFRLKF